MVAGGNCDATEAAAGAAATGVDATEASVDPAAADNCAITVPCLTLSPTFARMLVMTPAWEEGISIEALSDSTVINP